MTAVVGKFIDEIINEGVHRGSSGKRPSAARQRNHAVNKRKEAGKASVLRRGGERER